MTRVVYCCNHRKCVRSPVMFIHDGHDGGEFRCEKHAPLDWQIDALRRELTDALLTLFLPVIAWLEARLPAPKWIDLPGKGWRYCLHGWLGWSYQKPRRAFRYCRCCGLGQQRLPRERSE